MFDKVVKFFNVELLEVEGIYDMFDKILLVICKYSEDLWEDEYYFCWNWIEFCDDEDFYEVILYVFDDGGEYVCSVNGNIECGEW